MEDLYMLSENIYTIPFRWSSEKNSHLESKTEELWLCRSFGWKLTRKGT